MPAGISNHMPSKMWDQITYWFPIFNDYAIEVWKWISNFISHFITDVIKNEPQMTDDKAGGKALLIFINLSGCFQHNISFYLYW